MKIRIKGASIRIRVTRGELDRFGREGYLEEQTEFGTATFTYALQQSEELSHLSAVFDGGKITMYVPGIMAREWTGTERVGYEYHQDIANGKQLFLLLEKDFKCLDGEVAEDQTDQFDNPLTACL